MQNIAVIRSIEGRLVWYPPGSSDGPRDLESDAAQDALRAAIAQKRFTPVFAVPGEDARLLHLQINAEEKKHLVKSLPFMLEEQMAVDIADLHFAHQFISQLELAVAVCSVDTMRTFASRLAAYPGVHKWLPESLLLPWQSGEWCLVLEGENAIVRTGRCEGFSIERSMLPALLQACLGEGDRPDTVIVYGQQQDADTQLLPDEVRDSVQWRQGDLYTAMLLADEPDPPLNLCQGEFAVRLPLQRWWRQWRTVAALFAAGLALHMLATYMDYRQLQQENVALRTAVQDTYRRAYPRGAIVDAEKQLQRQLDALSGSGQSSGFVSLMDRVGGVIAASNGTSIVSINYSDKAAQMRLNIIAANYEAVEQVRAGINEAGLQATMENSSAQNGKVRARLRVEEKS